MREKDEKNSTKKEIKSYPNQWVGEIFEASLQNIYIKKVINAVLDTKNEYFFRLQNFIWL